MNTIKTPAELAEARVEHIKHHSAEFKAALEPVLYQIEMENKSGRCMIKLTLGVFGVDRWSWHIGEVLRKEKYKVTQKTDGKTKTNYLEIRW